MTTRAARTQSSRSAFLMLIALALLLAASAPSPARAQKPTKFQASAVQVMFVESEEVRLPPEFQVALYENLIREIQKTGKFQRVYRDGEQGAADVKDLVILRSNVLGFKPGSAMARQVTTVAGATEIRVHVLMTTHDNRIILDRAVVGKVRFFGENLRATFNFAKSVAKLVRETF